MATEEERLKRLEEWAKGVQRALERLARELEENTDNESAARKYGGARSEIERAGRQLRGPLF